MRAAREAGSAIIPLIDRNPDYPSDPIACQTAAARSAGQGRPHSGRRSHALDRSEHDGRLSAFGRGGAQACPRFSFFRIMRAAAACMMLTLSGIECRAESGSLPPPTSVSTDHRHAGDPWAVSIAEAARRFDIPERWIRSVMGVESDGDTRAVSPKGAMGLMQVRPATWTELRARYGLGNDPFDPHDNIMAGAAYLREMHDRYGSPGFLAAYNAGPARYEEHMLLGVPLPGETQSYLDKLASIAGKTSPGLFAGSAAGAAGGPEPSLFAVDTRAKSDPARTPQLSPGGALFATIKPRAEHAESADGDSPDVQTD